MNNIAENLPDLTDFDNQFALTISTDYELTRDEMEFLMKIVLKSLNSLCEWFNNHLKNKVIIQEINYNSELTDSESNALKSLSDLAVVIIDYYFKTNDYKKFIIAALILKHYRLDKYSRILDKEDYDPYGCSDNDYKHYLYSRMKSRFKTSRKKST